MAGKSRGSAGNMMQAQISKVLGASSNSSFKSFGPGTGAKTKGPSMPEPAPAAPAAPVKAKAAKAPTADVQVVDVSESAPEPPVSLGQDLDPKEAKVRRFLERMRGSESTVAKDKKKKEKKEKEKKEKADPATGPMESKEMKKARKERDKQEKHDKKAEKAKRKQEDQERAKIAAERQMKRRVGKDALVISSSSESEG
eukprot:TRINITY_DN4279_c0_g1_i12.p1 TRINITY_DN4279_c0_g1~~TRINITY_DN4279_c0_g1_i12.p1  ORF type:complete len:198 (+),score=60.66 TRINITY_DN4279_c0_g1_i12:134-727(+)